MILHKKITNREKNMKTKKIINITQKKRKTPITVSYNIHSEYYLYRKKMLTENIHLTKKCNVNILGKQGK